METEAVARIVLVIAVLAAYALTVVPVLPGAALVPVGAVAYGLIVGFHPFHWGFWAGQVLLVALAFVVDNVVQALGVGRLGGSRTAMWGGAIGVFVGPFVFAFLGPLALILGPPAGAVAGTVGGELVHRRRLRQLPAEEAPGLRELGVTAALSYLASMFAKLCLLTVQVAWLAWIVLRA